MNGDQRTKPRRVLPALAVLAVGLWFAGGIYKVRSEQRAVVQVFGAVTDHHVPAGLHWNWPWPIGRVTVLSSDRVRSVQFGVTQIETITGRRASDARTQYMTADQGLVQVLVRAQYTIKNERAYLFTITPALAEKIVISAVESAITRLVGRYRWDAILKDPLLKSMIFVKARTRAQRQLDEYKSGVNLKGVSLVDLKPPGAVLGAFNDVLSAQSEANGNVRQAEGEAERRILTAQATATERRLDAQAYANRLVELAEAERMDFPRRAAAFRAAPELTARLIFLETMREVLPRAKKVIVPTEAGPQPLDLSIIGP